MTDTANWVPIERRFAAPIEDVWAMWTDPARFQEWYGPSGMSVPVAEMNVVVGGQRKICMEMRTPDRTMKMWFVGTYIEVTAPTRLVYAESMSDADGNILSPASMGMPPGTPDVTEVHVDLRERAGATDMVMVHKGVPAGSPGEGGWQQAFDKLAGLLGNAA